MLAVALLVVPVSGVLAASTAGVEVTATPLYLDIDNTPSGTEGLGTLAENSTTYAYAAGPTFPIEDTTATFTITNNSSVGVDIGISATDFTGGVGWTLASSVGENTVVMKAGFEGEEEVDMQVVTNSNLAFITGLAAAGDIDWEFSLDTGTFTDGDLRTSNITLTATAAS